MGLDNIHSLSKQGQNILQVELSDEGGQQQAARYQFHLDGEEEKFALHLEQRSGAQEDVMATGASGVPFSTADRDNDLAEDINCAELLSGTTPSLKLFTSSHRNKKNRLNKSQRRPFIKNTLLLQVVGGSAAAVSQTSMESIPEGRACSGDTSPEDRGCFQQSQRNRETLSRRLF